MFKTLFLTTILAATFTVTPVVANEDVEKDQKNLTPARKAEQNEDGQKTYIQGSTQGNTQGTEDSQKYDNENSVDKNLTPARKAKENEN